MRLKRCAGRSGSTRDELDERIKVAFAQYYAVSRGIAINADIARLARQMTGAAIARYSQGRGIAGRRYSGGCRRNPRRDRSGAA